MNRLDRLTAILIQLQAKKVVKAQDIAERFAISLRTVYRDVRTLEEAGVPIIGEAGVGYSLMDGYRLPPVMFTTEEATAFLTAEKFIQKFTDTSTVKNYTSAMYKIRSVLRSNEKDLLENMDGYIEIFGPQSPFPETEDNSVLFRLLKNITEKKALHITYSTVNSNETSKRVIEPLGIYYAGGYWYTIAWCCMRQAYRNFRIDGIKSIHSTDASYGQNHPRLKDYLDELAKQQQVDPITIRIKKEIALHLRQSKYRYGFVEERADEGYIEMTFLSDPDVLARYYCMFADYAEIVSPVTFHSAVKEHFRKISEKFS